VLFNFFKCSKSILLISLSGPTTVQKCTLFKKSWKIPKEVIRSRESKMNRQHNGQRKVDKRAINDLNNSTAHKTKD